MTVENHSVSPRRLVAAVVGAAVLAWVGGAILGEYPFVGDGIQFLPIMGGAGLGAVIAWVVNRACGGRAPVWLGVLAGLLAVWGEVRAVQEDTPAGVDWPLEGWLAIAAAGVVAWYVTLVSARRA